MLPNVGTWEMLIILLVVFLVFGSKRLPDVARGIGKGLREFKREMAGLTEELNKVTQEPPRSEPIAPKPAAEASSVPAQSEPTAPAPVAEESSVPAQNEQTEPQPATEEPSPPTNGNRSDEKSDSAGVG